MKPTISSGVAGVGAGPRKLVRLAHALIAAMGEALADHEHQRFPS